MEDFEKPWIIDAGKRWFQGAWAKSKEDWERRMAEALRVGENIRQPLDVHEARLEGEEEAELQARVAERLTAQDQARAWEEDAGGLPTRDITSQGNVAKALGIDRREVPAYLGGTPKEKEKKEMDLMEQAFLMSMMESMRGEDIGQAPAVVAGGGQRQWPSMMGQFAPWEQQKPYWWIT
jgi:hypothetical protein